MIAIARAPMLLPPANDTEREQLLYASLLVGGRTKRDLLRVLSGAAAVDGREFVVLVARVS